MLSVVQVGGGSFCEEFCNFIASKVKWKTNTIIFTVGFISLVIHEEIGSAKKPAGSVKICRAEVHGRTREDVESRKEEGPLLGVMADPARPLPSFSQWLL